jgi:DNA-binding PadR family transcriptional regulator
MSITGTPFAGWQRSFRYRRPSRKLVGELVKRKRTCPCEGQTLDRLLQPTVMALLVKEPLHGYALIDRLKDSPLMKGSAPDPTGVYRLLNTLEEQGMVSHAWSESEEGPAKRLYKLTSSGRTCVEEWIDTLDGYHKDIGRLVKMMRKVKSA